MIMQLTPVNIACVQSFFEAQPPIKHARLLYRSLISIHPYITTPRVSSFLLYRKRITRVLAVYPIAWSTRARSSSRWWAYILIAVNRLPYFYWPFFRDSQTVVDEFCPTNETRSPAIYAMLLRWTIPKPCNRAPRFQTMRRFESLPRTPIIRLANRGHPRTPPRSQDSSESFCCPSRFLFFRPLPVPRRRNKSYHLISRI